MLLRESSTPTLSHQYRSVACFMLMAVRRWELLSMSFRHDGPFGVGNG